MRPAADGWSVAVHVSGTGTHVVLASAIAFGVWFSSSGQQNLLRLQIECLNLLSDFLQPLAIVTHDSPSASETAANAMTLERSPVSRQHTAFRDRYRRDDTSPRLR